MLCHGYVDHLVIDVSALYFVLAYALFSQVSARKSYPLRASITSSGNSVRRGVGRGGMMIVTPYLEQT